MKHIFPTFGFLMLCVVTGYGDASSGAYSYWTAALGNTPMPEAIKDNIMHGSTMWECWCCKIGCKQTSDQDSDTSVFFVDKDLHFGSKFNLKFPEDIGRSMFLPREVVESIPFLSSNFTHIVDRFSVEKGSPFAYQIQATLTTCEKKMTLTNQKYCATSLESMVDYVTSELGRDAKAFSSTVPKETMMQEYVVSRVRKLGVGRSAAISCHKIGYPYTVFVCYKQAARTPYTLEAADGSKIKAAVLCHKDAPCRFLYQHDVL